MTRRDHIIDAATAVRACYDYAGDVSEALDEYQDDNEITFTDDERFEVLERAWKASR